MSIVLHVLKRLVDRSYVRCHKENCWGWGFNPMFSHFHCSSAALSASARLGSNESKSGGLVWICRNRVFPCWYLEAAFPVFLLRPDIMDQLQVPIFPIYLWLEQRAHLKLLDNLDRNKHGIHVRHHKNMKGTSDMEGMNKNVGGRFQEMCPCSKLAYQRLGDVFNI
jgi:hypothetical protein